MDTEVRNGARTTVNWILAILTAPAALAVVVYSYLQVLGTAGCSDGAAPSSDPTKQSSASSNTAPPR